MRHVSRMNATFMPRETSPESLPWEWEFFIRTRFELKNLWVSFLQKRHQKAALIPKAALPGQLSTATSGRTWLPGTALLIPILEGATLPARQCRELSAANKSSFGKEPYFPWMRHVSRMNASLCVAWDDRRGVGLDRSIESWKSTLLGA